MPSFGKRTPFGNADIGFAPEDFGTDHTSVHLREYLATVPMEPASVQKVNIALARKRLK
jgi:hypothetical protein